MLRILRCFSPVKCGVPRIPSFTLNQKRTYPADQPPSDEGSDHQAPPPEGQPDDIKRGLYPGGPMHLRIDRSHCRTDHQGRDTSADDGHEEEHSEDPPMEDEEVEGILESIYSGEPLHLRVNQIQRDADEIQMMGRLDQEHVKKDGEDEEHDYAEISAMARKWREMRSERYFPKLKKPPRASTLNELKVETVVRSYWSRGHLAALIDPLYIVRQPMFRPEFPSRTVLKQHRVPVDRDTLYHLLSGDSTTLGGGYNKIRLDKLMKRLNAAYCNTIGAEFSYVHDIAAKHWIKDRMETIELRHMHRDQQRYCMEKLIEIQNCCEYIRDKVPKDYERYIPLGSETSLLGVDLLIERAVKKHNARNFTIGMRRLGRSTCIMTVLGLDKKIMFALKQSDIGTSRDYYCLGCKTVTPSSFVPGVMKTVTMMSSCSIPENFYPLTLGYVKGLQVQEDDHDGEKAWPIIIHMAKGLNSQGIIYETLKLSQLPDYNVFGTIHIIFNNQMEQTLRRETHMTTEYCTDTLRTINIPIFHVNGDDLDAVHFVMRMAADFRATFKRDVAVDIVSYSRFMTQRLAVKFDLIKVQQAISQTEPIVKKFSASLLKEGVITQTDLDNWQKNHSTAISTAWQDAMKMKTPYDRKIWSSQMFLDKIEKLEKKYPTVDEPTGVKLEKLKLIAARISQAPENINLNPKHIGYLKRRRHLIEMDKLDWVLCEALAYGSLLLEGKYVRISGMDVNRRLHIVGEDAADGETYNLLNNISPNQMRYYLCQSTTSQYATAAFEYGYSTSTYKTLVIWEAPEGDKTSKAQVVIDHYIAGGYLKYNYHSNIVFLLPHYHSCETSSKVCNGRPERFLQLTNDCDTTTDTNMKRQIKDTNMILANVSTPANLFHILRRQMFLPYKRPLVIFTPNLLGSHPDSKAKFSDISSGTKFQPYLPDDAIENILGVRKILICTGRIYYDLKTERKIRGLEKEVAICRIEQIAPLPYKIINDDLLRYCGPKKMAWVQEEPINQGWWNYLEPRLSNLPSVGGLECVAKPARADGGSRSINSCHNEQVGILERAFHL